MEAEKEELRKKKKTEYVREAWLEVLVVTVLVEGR